jgi:DNA-directed RNA polymerase subunit K/omega
MGRISKNNSVYAGKKNVDISSVINNTTNITKSNIKTNAIVNNQVGGKKNNSKKNTKQNDDDSEFGLSDDEADDDEVDDDDDEVDDEVDDENANDDEQNIDGLNNEQNEDIDDDENANDTYSDKSDKESNADADADADADESNDIGDEEKNYIDDEETLKTKCYSKYAKVDYDDLDFDELFGEEEVLVGKNIRVSKPVLTKYEFVRLLTDRTKQLAQGAKQMLKNTQELSSKEIAKLEIKERIIPLIIERPIPNSKSERWKISELHIPEHFFSM